MATGEANESLVSFKSGHYKKIRGKWAGDSVWCHFKKEDGGMVHLNKAEIEYIESFAPKMDPEKVEFLRAQYEKNCEAAGITPVSKKEP